MQKKTAGYSSNARKCRREAILAREIGLLCTGRCTGLLRDSSNTTLRRYTVHEKLSLSVRTTENGVSEDGCVFALTDARLPRLSWQPADGARVGALLHFNLQLASTWFSHRPARFSNPINPPNATLPDRLDFQDGRLGLESLPVYVISFHSTLDFALTDSGDYDYNLVHRFTEELGAISSVSSEPAL